MDPKARQAIPERLVLKALGVMLVPWVQLVHRDLRGPLGLLVLKAPKAIKVKRERRDLPVQQARKGRQAHRGRVLISLKAVAIAAIAAVEVGFKLPVLIMKISLIEIGIGPAVRHSEWLVTTNIRFNYLLGRKRDSNMPSIVDILPEHILKLLSESKQRFIATTYIVLLVMGLIVGAIATVAGFVGRNWINKSHEWSVFEFGRLTEECRLGEMIFTSTISPNNKYADVVKLVAGYTDKNEKFWIDSNSDAEEIRLLGANGTQQIFKMSRDRSTYLLQEIIDPNGNKRKGNDYHYLSKVYKPGLLGGIVENSRYRYSSTCNK